MNQLVQGYINRINAKDKTLQGIYLCGAGLTNADIAPLLQAINGNKVAAERILTLDLSFNELTWINMPATLVNLEALFVECNKLNWINMPATLVKLKRVCINGNNLTWIKVPATMESLDLNRNPLTIATRIGLEALRPTLGNYYTYMSYCYRNVTAEDQLTNDILDEHFKHMLRDSHEQIISYLKETGAEWFLSYLPADVAAKISEYVAPIPGVGSALASMNNFRDIFSSLPMLNEANNEQLNTLERYNEMVLQKLIKKIKDYYANAFKTPTIRIRALANKFLIENGFDSTDLSKKNAQGFTPLALANKETRQFIERRAPKGIMYRYLATASETVYKHKDLVAIGVSAITAAAAGHYLGVYFEKERHVIQ